MRNILHKFYQDCQSASRRTLQTASLVFHCTSGAADWHACIRAAAPWGMTLNIRIQLYFLKQSASKLEFWPRIHLLLLSIERWFQDEEFTPAEPFFHDYLKRETKHHHCLPAVRVQSYFIIWRRNLLCINVQVSKLPGSSTSIWWRVFFSPCLEWLKHDFAPWWFYYFLFVPAKKTN